MTTDAHRGGTLAPAELQSLKGMEPAPAGDPSLRFVQRCQDWNKEWIDANEHTLQANAVPSCQILMLIFVEAPEVEHPDYNSLKTELTRVFARTYAQDAQGVVLCNENFRHMYRICPSIDSLDSAFALALKHLKTASTFVIASLSQRRMFFHLPGGRVEEWCANPTSSDLRLSSKPLSATRIEEDVQEFHDEHLRYAKSSVAQMVWKGKKYPYKLMPLPERRIQSYLLIQLRGTYKHFDGIVDEEVVGKAGRCDVRVTWPSPIGSQYPYTTAMLELKVLIEGNGPTYHRRWVTSGIKQADRYRRVDTEAVYTCVFDARKDQSDQMLDLDAVANGKHVRLRRYLMEAPLADNEHESATEESDDVDVDAGTAVSGLKRFGRSRRKTKAKPEKISKADGTGRRKPGRHK